MVALSSQPSFSLMTLELPMAVPSSTSSGIATMSGGQQIAAAVSLTSLLHGPGSASMGKAAEVGNSLKRASTASTASTTEGFRGGRRSTFLNSSGKGSL